MVQINCDFRLKCVCGISLFRAKIYVLLVKTEVCTFHKLLIIGVGMWIVFWKIQEPLLRRGIAFYSDSDEQNDQE